MCGKTTFFKTTGTNRERPTVFEAYLTVHPGNYTLQIVHRKRLSRLPTCNSQGFCHLPAEPLNLRCYTHSDWARDKTTRRSTSGWLCSSLGTPLSYASRTQSTVPWTGETHFKWTGETHFKVTPAACGNSVFRTSARILVPVNESNGYCRPWCFTCHSAPDCSLRLKIRQGSQFATCGRGNQCSRSASGDLC